MEKKSVSGGQEQSSCGSQLDFVSYWADKTVEEAVLLGTQLREQKPHYLPKRECNVLNIDYIKPPFSSLKNRSRRNKSPKKYVKRHKSRYNSPDRRECSQAKKTAMRKKKREKSKNKLTCGVRIAQLAVPTKRQCLDTWRNKCNTLPAFMIERLRQHVMDLRPVVHISDAIYCFKRKSCKNDKKRKTPEKITESSNKETKKLFQSNELKTLSAIFGYQISKKLYIPISIKFNSDLQKLASVVSNDVEDLMCKSKTINTNNGINQSIHKEITDKITIWISDVLEESSYKMLEDHLRDFEEEAGPALDIIDELVHGVLAVCVPEPVHVIEKPSGEFEEAHVGKEGIIQACSEELCLKYPSILEDKPVDAVPITDVYFENLEEYFQNELITIINKMDKEADTTSDGCQDFDDGPEWQPSEDTETKGTETNNDEYLKSEDAQAIDTEMKNVEYLESEDAEEINTKMKNYEYLESENSIAAQATDNAEAEDTNIKHEEFVESKDVIAFQTNENTEEQDTDIKNDVHLVSEDDVALQPSEMAEIPDDKNEIFADAREKNEDFSEVSSDENNKKVKFDEIVDNTESITEPQTDGENLDWKVSIDRIKFAAPNEDLLSNADESWPEEFQSPVIRPSQSVSKSITSLGNINEDEEKASTLPIDTFSEPEEQTHENIENKLELKTESIKEQKTEDQPISTDDNAEDLSSHQQEPVIESLETTPVQETTPEHEDKIDDKLTKEETAPKDLVKPEAIKKKEKKISESVISKSSSKKPTPIAKKKTPRQTQKPKEEINPAPKPIPKAKIVGKRKAKTPKVKSRQKREDIETAGTSKSVKDLGRDDVEKAKDVKFSSIRVKTKPDYRVHADTAPAWITRTHGEPTCICVNIDSKNRVKNKVISENDLTRWCRDLAKGYEKLKMWNDWIDNTSRTVCMLQREIGALECPEGYINNEWIKLKRNIDKDATLWKKLNRNTRERIQSYKKMYQKRSEIRTNYEITCASSERPK